MHDVSQLIGCWAGSVDRPRHGDDVDAGLYGGSDGLAGGEEKKDTRLVFFHVMGFHNLTAAALLGSGIGIEFSGSGVTANR